ncbi:hypothetical protein ACFPRL_29995 [Pseudoclavibacter helvolus]
MLQVRPVPPPTFQHAYPALRFGPELDWQQLPQRRACRAEPRR